MELRECVYFVAYLLQFRGVFCNKFSKHYSQSTSFVIYWKYDMIATFYPRYAIHF